MFSAVEKRVSGWGAKLVEDRKQQLRMCKRCNDQVMGFQAARTVFPRPCYQQPHKPVSHGI